MFTHFVKKTSKQCHVLDEFNDVIIFHPRKKKEVKKIGNGRAITILEKNTNSGFKMAKRIFNSQFILII